MYCKQRSNAHRENWETHSGGLVSIQGRCPLLTERHCDTWHYITLLLRVRCLPIAGTGAYEIEFNGVAATSPGGAEERNKMQGLTSTCHVYKE